MANVTVERKNPLPGVALSYPLILASSSPRRKELLALLGWDFSVLPPSVDETNKVTEKPDALVLRLSSIKARTVARNHPDSLVLAADTIVVIDDRILGKPLDRREAEGMLSLLSGRTHEVYTGFALCLTCRGFEYAEVVQSHVTFRRLTRDEVAWYAETDEPYDKAGAYAVQGKGAAFIKAIRGSYTNVIGLPLCEVVECMMQERFLTFSSNCR